MKNFNKFLIAFILIFVSAIFIFLDKEEIIANKSTVDINNSINLKNDNNKNIDDNTNSTQNDEYNKLENEIDDKNIQQKVDNSIEDKNEETTTKKEKDNKKDKYLTDPTPDGKPKPVEPQDTSISNKQMKATLSIKCDTLLDNISNMNQEKVELVPPDGIILSSTEVIFFEGESVFDVLKRETKANNIHLEYSFTPMYNSAYIEGIHNLYEFDGGNLSGWMYKVNGWFPNYGASRYQLKDGDIIEWVYTCDLGRDVGGYVPESE